MHRCRYLPLLSLLLLAPSAADARYITKDAAPPQAQQFSLDTFKEKWIWRIDCTVEQTLKAGTISLARLYTDEGKLDGGDYMRWNPSAYDPQRRLRPLDIELSYIWEPARQPAVEMREIEVKLRVGTDADLPEVALLHIQRPFPVQPHGIIGSTGLSTQIFPYGAHDLKNGHGELPLGDLLAYAEGYDTLGWALLRPSDRLGGGQKLAQGTIDIAALREAVAALPKLRRALAAKAADPKATCRRVQWPDMTRF